MFSGNVTWLSQNVEQQSSKNRGVLPQAGEQSQPASYSGKKMFDTEITRLSTDEVTIDPQQTHDSLRESRRTPLGPLYTVQEEPKDETPSFYDLEAPDTQPHPILVHKIYTHLHRKRARKVKPLSKEILDNLDNEGSPPILIKSRDCYVRKSGSQCHYDYRLPSSECDEENDNEKRVTDSAAENEDDFFDCMNQPPDYRRPIPQSKKRRGQKSRIDRSSPNKESPSQFSPWADDAQVVSASDFLQRSKAELGILDDPKISLTDDVSWFDPKEDGFFVSRKT